MSVRSPCKFRPYHTGAKTKHVHIIVLDSLVRGKSIMAKPGTNTGKFVCRNTCADTAAADKDRPFGPSFHQRTGHGSRKIRIINRILTAGSLILHSMSQE